MRYAKTITLTTLGLLCLAGRATALDLLPNGKFDSSIADWGGSPLYGTRTWDPGLDASGSDLSGSAKLVHTENGGGTALQMTRCFTGPEVQPGSAFFAGAKLRFGEGEAVAGTGYVFITFYADTACKAGRLDDWEIRGVDTDEVPRGTWTAVKVGSSTSGVVVPAGAVSARLGISVFKTANTGEPLAKLTMNVDDAFFAQVGTPLCDDMPATIAGTTASDFLNGTDGSDVIVGRGSIDWIDGKGGNDRLCGGPAPTSSTAAPATTGCSARAAATSCTAPTATTCCAATAATTSSSAATARTASSAAAARTCATARRARRARYGSARRFPRAERPGH